MSGRRSEYNARHVCVRPPRSLRLVFPPRTRVFRSDGAGARRFVFQSTVDVIDRRRSRDADVTLLAKRDRHAFRFSYIFYFFFIFFIISIACSSDTNTVLIVSDWNKIGLQVRGLKSRPIPNAFRVRGARQIVFPRRSSARPNLLPPYRRASGLRYRYSVPSIRLLVRYSTSLPTKSRPYHSRFVIHTSSGPPYLVHVAEPGDPGHVSVSSGSLDHIRFFFSLRDLFSDRLTV